MEGKTSAELQKRERELEMFTLMLKGFCCGACLGICGWEEVPAPMLRRT
jgi:hypothetical protein